MKSKYLVVLACTALSLSAFSESPVVDYTLSESIGGPISKEQANGWIDDYRMKNTDGPWAFFFGEDIIDQVTDHREAVGMRVYLGYDKNMELKMLLVGAREDGSDIWPNSGEIIVRQQEGEATVGDVGWPCPPACASSPVANKLSESVGGPISKVLAENWIDKYKKSNSDGPWAYFFGNKIIGKVIGHWEAVGMRVYLGYDENMELQMMLVGAREDGSDIWPSSGKSTAQSEEDGGIIADIGHPCPPYCQ